MTPVEQLDTTQNAVDRVDQKSEQSQQNLSSRLWEDLRSNSDKYVQVARSLQESSLNVLDFNIDSIYGSSLDTMARKAPHKSSEGQTSERSQSRSQESTTEDQSGQTQERRPEEQSGQTQDSTAPANPE